MAILSGFCYNNKKINDGGNMKKRYNCSVILLFLICILFMTGCTTNYTKEDIEKYVRQNVGLHDFTVSDEYRIRTDDDGYDDRIWAAKDNHTGMTFHIIDNYYWSAEWMANRLEDDYDSAFLYFIKKDLPETPALSIDLDIEDGIYSAGISGSFTDENGLKELWKDLLQLQLYFRKIQQPDLSVRYQFQYLHPVRNATSHEWTQGDTWGWTDEMADYSEMLNSYIQMAMEYRYPGTYENLPADQLEHALKDYEFRVRIQRADGSIECYDNIIANPFYYGISYGALYEILLQEGFAPEGNPGHYSFTGMDGCSYEISYDYTDYPYPQTDGTVQYGYYYLKDGEQTPMDFYFYHHFETDEIKDMTGLQLYDNAITEPAAEQSVETE